MPTVGNWPQQTISFVWFSLPILTKVLPLSLNKAFQFSEKNNLGHKPQTHQKFVFHSNLEGMRT